MLWPLSKVITLLPAKSISNKEGASAASEAIATAPVLPAPIGTLICTLAFSAVAWEPVAQIIISNALIVASALLNKISVMIVAVEAAVTTSVLVKAAAPEATLITGYLAASVAYKMIFEEVFGIKL